MESSVVIDQARRSNTSTKSRSLDYNSNGRSFYLPSSSPSPSSLFTPRQQDQVILLLNNRAGSVAGSGGGFSFPGPRPSPAFTSSRPPILTPTTHSSISHYHLQHQSTWPPLLPRPFSRSVSVSLPPPPLLPPNPRKSNGNKQRRPNKPSPSNRRKEKSKPKTEAAKSPVAEEEEMEMAEDEKVYSMSPPPSSLPLPTFSLKSRSTPTAASCNAEALGGVGEKGGVEGGVGTATDDLRRLLRL